MRVLVIEDVDDAANSLKDVLELAGHVVDVAADGPTGLAKAFVASPDVVLCDIGLPGMNGYDVARAIRAKPSLKTVRLVATTGFADARSREQALAAGFDVCLAKPLDMDSLLRIVAARGGDRPSS